LTSALHRRPRQLAAHKILVCDEAGGGGHRRYQPFHRIGLFWSRRR
jgi:hypothetical protein